MRRKLLHALGLIAVVMILFTACPADDPPVLPVYTSYGGSQAPGDYWEYQIDHDLGSFIAVNYGTSYGRTVGFTYKGTVVELPSKFLKFTVTETDNAAVPVGSVSYGIDYPGNCLFVMPNINNTDNFMISMTVLADATYTAGMKFNWITLPTSSFDIDTISTYGLAEITSVAGADLQLATAGTLFNGGVGYASMPLYSTVEGHKLYSYQEPAKTTLLSVMSITPSGAFAYDMGSGGGGFGLTAPSADVDVADALAHPYRGFNTFYGGSMSGIKATWTAPVSGAPLKLEGGFYVGNDPSAAQDAGNQLDFSAAAQSSPGILSGITDGYSQPYIFIINKINDKYVLLGFGKTTDGSGDDWPFTFFVIQAD